MRNKEAICETCLHFYTPKDHPYKLCHGIPDRKPRRMYSKEWCKRHPDWKLKEKDDE